MKSTFNILIIEDHELIIDVYKNAISVIKEKFKKSYFIVDTAKNYNTALNKINKASKNDGCIDLIFLDIQLISTDNNNINSGELLGTKIRELLPSAKIIVCTALNDNLRINSIFNKIRPESFLIKSDINFSDVVNSIKKTLSNKTYYSNSIQDYLTNKLVNNIILDELDVQILKEISNGSKMKELIQLIPLTKSGIERRRRLLRQFFSLKTDSDRELILTAKEKGFI